MEGYLAVLGVDRWELVMQSADGGLGVVLGLDCEEREIAARRSDILRVTKGYLQELWKKRD